MSVPEQSLTMQIMALKDIDVLYEHVQSLLAKVEV